MARAKSSTRKKKTYRSLSFTPSPGKKQIENKEIVLTLAASSGEVIKIEALEKSGRRRVLSDEEFADLAGEETVDLDAALEHAYATGIADALQDELNGDEDAEDEEILRRFILKIAAGRQGLRQGARKLILRRALHRRRAGRPVHAGVGTAGKRVVN